MEFFMQTLEEFIKSSLFELLDTIQKIRPEAAAHGAAIPYGNFTAHFEVDVVQNSEARNLVKGGSCGIFGFVATVQKEEGEIASNQQAIRLSFDLPLKLTLPNQGFAPIGKPKNLRVC